MNAPSRYTLLAILLLVAGACTGTRVRWVPSIANQVPDGTRVRYVESSGSVIHTETITFGRALAWQSSIPKLVTARGDTLVIPRGARIQVLLRDKKGHDKFGGILGYVVGAVLSIADCRAGQTCGEQDFRPMIGLTVGGVVGAMVRTDDWRTVTW